MSCQRARCVPVISMALVYGYSTSSASAGICPWSWQAPAGRTDLPGPIMGVSTKILIEDRKNNYIYIWIQILDIDIDTRINVDIHLHIYVCMFLHMYMYACIYIYIYI